MSPLMKVILVISLIFGFGTAILTNSAVMDSDIDVGYSFVEETDSAIEFTPGLTSADMAGTSWVDNYGYGYYFSEDGTTFSDMFGYECYAEIEPGVYYPTYDDYVNMAYPTTLVMENGQLFVTTWDADDSWWAEYVPFDMKTVFGGTEWIDENDVLYAFDENAEAFVSDSEQIDATSPMNVFRISNRYMLLYQTAADGAVSEREFQRNDIHYQLGGTSWLAADGMVYSFGPDDAYSLVSSDEVIWYSLLDENIYWRTIMLDEPAEDDDWSDEDYYDYYITCEGDELVIRSFNYDGEPVGEERLTRVTE